MLEIPSVPALLEHQCQTPELEEVHAAPAPAPPLVLLLQSSAGNQAVGRALAARRPLSRQPAAASARTPEQLAALNEDITRAIAEKETGREAIESNMETSAGVRASYASQVQATSQWSVGALQKLDDARLAPSVSREPSCATRTRGWWRPVRSGTAS